MYSTTSLPEPILYGLLGCPGGLFPEKNTICPLPNIII